MGLEGYRYRVPPIEQYPSYIPQDRLKYENMPEGAEERALAMRNDWINRHLGDVAQTFSKVVLTSADITSLLREVEADQSLVHAAYYTDDECVARVAEWIAGRG
jgi:rRNA maturation endonuclease Nob1